MLTYMLSLRLQCLIRCPQTEQAGEVKDHPKEKTCIVPAIAGNEMKVHVRNVLVSRLTVIQKEMRTIDSKAGPPLRRNDMVADFEQMLLRGLVEFFKSLCMLSGDDKYVAGP
jgi:hypothetical protein